MAVLAVVAQSMYWVMQVAQVVLATRQAPRLRREATAAHLCRGQAALRTMEQAVVAVPLPLALMARAQLAVMAAQAQPRQLADHL